MKAIFNDLCNNRFTTTSMIRFTTYRSSKQKLLRQMPDLGKKAFSEIINPIIAEKRRVTLNEAKAEKYLRSDEVIAFLEKIGEGLEGRGKEIVFASFPIKKSTVRNKIPLLSDRAFYVLSKAVVNEYRSGPKKFLSSYFLRPEVEHFLKLLGEQLTPK